MSQTITVLTGTNRPQSNTRKVATILKSIYEGYGAKVLDLDLGALPPSVFTPEIYAEKPAAFRPFADKVIKCDGLVVVTPEYNGSFPGILKYFIDLLPFPESFEHRPVAFVGLAAGMWGALRPVEQLQQIFGYRNGLIFPQRVLLPQIGNILNGQGKIKDPDSQDRLEAQAQDFLEFTKRLQGFKGATD